MKNILHLNGVETRIGEERNLLELIRNSGIELPTFCYHSELSVYGACRLCIVEIEGRGILASCSVKPEAGMKVRTHTEELRAMRRMNIELLLASHDQACTTCAKSERCSLLSLARKLGVDDMRFRKTPRKACIDDGNYSIVRDPGKCILCGDCVRFCHEIQGIGAIDFAYRGSAASVVPAFGKKLGEVECVMCGQCASVCPTGALTVKSELNELWRRMEEPGVKIVAQIAPAVRVAIGELFDCPPGEDLSGKLATALRKMGFHAVYDSSYSADIVAVEEANEYLERKANSENLPIITSCCPAWVNYCEQFFPEMIPNLSTCRSPQQALGAILKDELSRRHNVPREKILVVSIMPCSAKKTEARREEHCSGGDGKADIDIVIGTSEVARMIKEAGLDLAKLAPSAMDMPFGFKTGAGVIFGAGGGVAEAVLRIATDESGLADLPCDELPFAKIYGDPEKGPLRIAVASGLANAGRLISAVKDGSLGKVDLIEVMACPGGCVNGAAQPPALSSDTIALRRDGLRKIDMGMELRRSPENPFIHIERTEHERHRLLHTGYHARRRIEDDAMEIVPCGKNAALADVTVCVGTSCFLKGSRKIIAALMELAEKEGYKGRVAIKATFCHEICDRGPSLTVNGVRHERCSPEKAVSLVKSIVGIMSCG